MKGDKIYLSFTGKN